MLPERLGEEVVGRHHSSLSLLVTVIHVVYINAVIVTPPPPLLNSASTAATRSRSDFHLRPQVHDSSKEVIHRLL